MSQYIPETSLFPLEEHLMSFSVLEELLLKPFFFWGAGVWALPVGKI